MVKKKQKTKTNPKLSVSQISSSSLAVQIAGVPACASPHFDVDHLILKAIQGFRIQKSVTDNSEGKAGFFTDRGIG